MPQIFHTSSFLYAVARVCILFYTITCAVKIKDSFIAKIPCATFYKLQSPS